MTSSTCMKVFSQASSGNQAPETVFAAVLEFQLGGISPVRLEGAEAPDRGREACALHEMPRGMPITARSGLGEREVDHRPEHERRGQRVLGGKCIRRWRQD